MYEICKTELYDDCLVGNLDTFVQDISSNPHKVDLLGRVKTLRLYEADTSLLKEPTYLQLVSNEEWPYLVAKKNANDFYRPLQLAKQQIPLWTCCPRSQDSYNQKSCSKSTPANYDVGRRDFPDLGIVSIRIH
jgi:hypothetical protein